MNKINVKEGSMKPLQVTENFVWSLGTTAAFDVGDVLTFTLTLTAPAAGTYYVSGVLLDANGVAIPGTWINLVDAAGTLVDQSAMDPTVFILALDESTGALPCAFSTLAYSDVGLQLMMYRMVGATPNADVDTWLGNLSTILTATPAADTGIGGILEAMTPIIMIVLLMGMVTPMLKGVTK